MKIIKEASRIDEISLILLTLFAGLFFVFLTFQYVGVGALENWFWVTRVVMVACLLLLGFLVTETLKSKINLKNGLIIKIGNLGAFSAPCFAGVTVI